MDQRDQNIYESEGLKYSRYELEGFEHLGY